MSNNYDYDKIKTLAFSKRLQVLRDSSGLSQKEMADLLGIKQPAYARYEMGRVFPRDNILEKLANIFHTTKYDLVNDSGGSLIYDEENGITTLTVVIPQELLDVNDENTKKNVLELINGFTQKEINLLYQCVKVIDINSSTSKVMEYYDLDNVNISDILLDDKN